MAAGRLKYDIYPAQAPSNCCCALPGAATAYKLFSKLRPRRCRKTVYQSRLHEGSCDLSDARRLFGYCAASLPPSTREELEAQLSRLEEERQTFDKFFEYYGSHKAQRDALIRAQAFCGRARDILRKVMVLHEGWSISQTNQHKRQVHSSARSPVQGHYESPNTPHGIAARSYHQVLVPHADSPLQTMQIRASPVVWMPSPPPTHNALDIELGPRMSPRPRVMTPPIHPYSTPSGHSSPWSPASSLGLGTQLANFSPASDSRKVTPASSPARSSRRQSHASGRTTTICSTTDLPHSMASSPTRRSPRSVTYSDHRSYHHPSPGGASWHSGPSAART